jgi:N-acetyl-anhydromuramyl-L-alanine amidase AmpD
MKEGWSTMEEIKKIEFFKVKGKNSNKKQIILTHTSRNIKDYITGLKNRNNGKYTKIPHYIIGRDGDIYQLMNYNAYNEYMNNSSVNRNGIVISFENLGWLRKNPLSGDYINWLGDTYRGDIYTKKWKGYTFWQPYTKEQEISVLKLIDYLCKETNIPNSSIGHNVKIDKIENFNGIVSCSNFDTERTDVNPAFNFDIFIKKD